MADYIIKELDYPMFENGIYTPIGDYKSLDAGTYLDSFGNLFCMMGMGYIPICIFMTFKAAYESSLVEVPKVEGPEPEPDQHNQYGTILATSESTVSESTFLKALAVVCGNTNNLDVNNV